VVHFIARDPSSLPGQTKKLSHCVITVNASMPLLFPIIYPPSEVVQTSARDGQIPDPWGNHSGNNARFSENPGKIQPQATFTLTDADTSPQKSSAQARHQKEERTMSKLLNLRTLIATLTLAAAAVVGHSSVSAGDHCHAPRYYYKTVTFYETIRKPYEYTAIKYDHCGQPYHVILTGWKTVQIPVTRQVRVQY
jgi:hypothetical protein